MNIDLLYDLLTYLKVILEFGNLPLRTSLQVLITASKLKTGLGEALNIDFKEYYKSLYNLLDFTIFKNNFLKSDDVIVKDFDEFNEKFLKSDNDFNNYEINFRLLIDSIFLLLIKPKKLPVIRIGIFFLFIKFI
jgi:hypothetical protein